MARKLRKKKCARCSVKFQPTFLNRNHCYGCKLIVVHEAKSKKEQQNDR